MVMKSKKLNSVFVKCTSNRNWVRRLQRNLNILSNDPEQIQFGFKCKKSKYLIYLKIHNGNFKWGHVNGHLWMNHSAMRLLFHRTTKDCGIYHREQMHWISLVANFIIMPTYLCIFHINYFKFEPEANDRCMLLYINTFFFFFVLPQQFLLVTERIYVQYILPVCYLWNHNATMLHIWFPFINHADFANHRALAHSEAVKENNLNTL